MHEGPTVVDAHDDAAAVAAVDDADMGAEGKAAVRGGEAVGRGVLAVGGATAGVD